MSLSNKLKPIFRAALKRFSSFRTLTVCFDLTTFTPAKGFIVDFVCRNDRRCFGGVVSCYGDVLVSLPEEDRVCKAS